MATTAGHIDAPLVRPVERTDEGFGHSLVRALSHAPVNIVLVVIGLLWLVPTLGLLFTSLLPARLISATGWWQVLSKPSQATLENYRNIFADHAITSALVTTVWISFGATIVPILVAALAAYAFAWMDFPGRETGPLSGSSPWSWCCCRWRSSRSSRSYGSSAPTST